ncbi:MAG: radical SAM protein, partial [Candidatus Omnitrophica bacterium]|nr:radical SAM protein [Candidatus Omnitrophota bacterium]
MAKIAFLQHIWYETIGPMYLSASVKARGHECDMFIGRDDIILKEALAYDPDIVCFSAMTAQFGWALNMAKKVKALSPDIIVAFGGAHATFFPEIIEEAAIDIVCVGEGEGALAELADSVDKRLDSTKIANLWVKKGKTIHKNSPRDLVADLDSLPSPDRALYYKYGFMANSPEKYFMSGRGCPYNCSFCFNHIYMDLYRGKGPFVRHRKVDNVINEIRQVKERYKLELVYFLDDTWVLNKRWLHEFLPVYRREIGLPFIAYVRADIVDEALVAGLKEAGCRAVDMGVETGDECRRNIILKKKVTDAELKNASRLLRKHKLKFRTTNMLALPGETLEDAF